MVQGESHPARAGSSRRGGPTFLVGLVLLASSPAGTSQEVATWDVPAYLAECVAAVESDPQDPEGYSCVYRAARAESRWQETAQAVRNLRGRIGSAPWWTMALGNLAWVSDPTEALEHYREAADGFAAEGLSRGEVLARFNLRMLLKQRGDLDAAGEQVDLAVAAAEGSREADVLAQALLLKATHLMESDGDLAEAEVALRRAERAAFPDGSYSLKRNCLVTQANLHFHLGHFDQAMRAYRRTAELAAEHDDPTEAATTAYNLANGRLRQLESLPEPGGIEEVERLGREALALAEAAELRDIEARSHRLLGDLFWRSGHPEQGRQHLQRCLELAREIDDPERELSCLFNRAESLALTDPISAERDSTAALELAERTASELYLAYAWRARMRVAWQTLKSLDALAESKLALDAIERLRDAQRETASSVGVFSAWTDDYYWLVGRLLTEIEKDGIENASATAFALAERMRGRRLLEEIGAERALPDPTQPLLEERQELRRAIADTQRHLLRPDLTGDARADRLARLDELEVDEKDLLLRLRATSPRSAVTSESLADLDSVRGALEEDQAFLYFLVGLDHDVFGQAAGGAWLWVVTRSSEQLVRIPDRTRLESQVPVFRGLVERRDPLEGEVAMALYGTLLDDALSGLPPEVHRLVIVPDGVLHHLPFAALRPKGQSPPLGARYELALSPSATLWLHWQGLEVPPSTGPALVFADPARPDEAANPEPAFVRGPGLGDPASLGPLPGARLEARTVRRSLGRGTRILAGEEASERTLKTASPGDFDVLHLAAHAVADEAYPHRSCVILAPGHPDEDGLLQVAEAERLDLAGRIVVLSACSTAAGTVRGGEGVMSLARAFFRAGARTVVATRWPLRDEEAARFFEHFYRRLAHGETVGKAARQARDKLYSAGLPGAAWAGIVVLGDDAAGVRKGGFLPPAAISALGLSALVIGALAMAALLRRLRSPT